MKEQLITLTLLGLCSALVNASQIPCRDGLRLMAEVIPTEFCSTMSGFGFDAPIYDFGFDGARKTICISNEDWEKFPDLTRYLNKDVQVCLDNANDDQDEFNPYKFAVRRFQNGRLRSR